MRNIKGDALLQKCFTKDFLTHKRVQNNGELPQYYVHDGHEAIINREVFGYVQTLIVARSKDTNGKYSGVHLYSSLFRCGKCGAFYGTKPEHSNDKYRRVILMCHNTFTKDFLIHKRVDNKGEVPQHYVEGHHEGIVTADQFEQVQAEFYRRQNMDRYSGVGCFSSIIRCGECGSWYGAKVWHSNNKYRWVIYRCNKKYGKGCKCKTPHITEDEIKEMFIKAANELFSEKDEIIENTKTMMDMVCNTDDLDKELGDKVAELNIIAEQMQTAIAENSRTALDQNEYERRYADLTERYNTIKADYDKISEQIESKKTQRELFKGFIRALEKQGALVEEFDEGLWSSLVQEVVITSKDDILFIFKNGFKIKTR